MVTYARNGYLQLCEQLVFAILKQIHYFCLRLMKEYQLTLSDVNMLSECIIEFVEHILLTMCIHYYVYQYIVTLT